MKLLLDCHSHSSHSFDAKDGMSEMCKRAMELGLAVYAITDHCECQGYYSADYYGKKPNKYEVFNFDEMTEASITEACEIKEKLAGRLNLICGVELGEATFDLAVAEKVVADKRLDYVIGSMHQIPNEKDFYFWEFNEGNAADTLDKYYKEIYKLCQWGKFDTLAHLTYPLRYIEGKFKLTPSFEPYKDIIAESMKLMIQKGIALEINTSGYRQAYGKPMPAMEHLTLYKDLGGELITIGADSHRIQDIAEGVTNGLELAQQAGFNYITYYKNRKPLFLPIE